jgi:hypothetical protein
MQQDDNQLGLLDAGKQREQKTGHALSEQHWHAFEA